MVKDSGKLMTYERWEEAYKILDQENDDVKNEKGSIIGNDMSRNKYEEMIEMLY